MSSELSSFRRKIFMLLFGLKIGIHRRDERHTTSAFSAVTTVTHQCPFVNPPVLQCMGHANSFLQDC